MDDFERAASESIDILIRTTQINADIISTAMQDYLTGNGRQTGEVPYKKMLQENKLEDVEIDRDNIGNFRKTAAKYGVSYSIKCDRSTEPPTYHLIFSAADKDTIGKAFKEHTSRVDKTPFNCRRLKRQKAKARKTPRKEKKLQRSDIAR